MQDVRIQSGAGLQGNGIQVDADQAAVISNFNDDRAPGRYVVMRIFKGRAYSRQARQVSMPLSPTLPVQTLPGAATSSTG